MIVRSCLNTGTVPTVAAGVLLFALAGASLGCAYAACYGVAEAMPPPATVLALPAVAAPAVEPIAGVEHGRCAGLALSRARRAGCRVADLPSV
ncbi:MAG: hypothetical protein WKG03_17080 [Telluria sp.]